VGFKDDLVLLENVDFIEFIWKHSIEL